MRRTVEVEVPGDRRGTGVEASGNELSSEGDDAVAHRHRSPLRARMWSPGAWLDGFEAALSISPEEPVQVAATDAAGSGRGRDGQLG
jgi:hypothetical protein